MLRLSYSTEGKVTAGSPGGKTDKLVVEADRAEGSGSEALHSEAADG